MYRDDDLLRTRTRRLSKPKADTFVRFEIQGICNKSRALIKQQKRTGLNKSWVNILVERDQKPSSANCDKARRWEETESGENVVGNNVFEKVRFCEQ